MQLVLSWIHSIPNRVVTGASALLRYARAHKIIAAIAVVVLCGLIYWAYSAWQTANTPAEYTLALTQTDTIQETVTASGQIASNHTLTLSPKSSGTVVSVRVSPGQKVAAGTIVATIDSTDAQKSLRDATLSLKSARLSYEKQQTSSDSLTSGLNTAATAVTDMQEALDGMDTILHQQDFPSYKLRDNVIVFGEVGKTVSTNTLLKEFVAAKNAFGTAQSAYNTTPRSASIQEVAALLETLKTTAQTLSQANKDILAAARATQTRLDSEGTTPSILATHIASLTTYGKTLNTTVTSTVSAKTDLSDSVIDTGSNEITLSKAENAYQDALDMLEDYIVRAPFAGTIATVDVQKYDEAGGSTKVATLITDTSYAELSLSETDAAKIVTGQKAELTFDAIDDFTVTGSVIQIDPVGTVTSGVVSYTVKIGLDSKDARIKPGMTVNATIVTTEKTDVVVVSSAAIKTASGKSYVEVAKGPSLTVRTASTTRPAPQNTNAMTARTRTANANEVLVTRVFVETGISSDTMTEIVSGISAGDYIVTQTTNASGKTVTQSKSIFSLFGGGNNRSSGAASGSSGTRTSNTAGAAAGGAGGPPPGAF